MIITPDSGLNRNTVFAALRAAEIEFRMITGGNILDHPVISYFDYSCAQSTENAHLLHTNGFFVGNFSEDATEYIDHLHRTLMKVAE